VLLLSGALAASPTPPTCSCGADDQCCSQYENCVSCCLKPEHEPEKLMHSVYRGRNKWVLGSDTALQWAANAAALLLDLRGCHRKGWNAGHVAARRFAKAVQCRCTWPQAGDGPLVHPLPVLPSGVPHHSAQHAA